MKWTGAPDRAMVMREEKEWEKEVKTANTLDK